MRKLYNDIIALGYLFLHRRPVCALLIKALAAGTALPPVVYGYGFIEKLLEHLPPASLVGGRLVVVGHRRIADSVYGLCLQRQHHSPHGGYKTNVFFHFMVCFGKRIFFPKVSNLFYLLHPFKKKTKKYTLSNNYQHRFFPGKSFCPDRLHLKKKKQPLTRLPFLPKT